MFRHALSFRRTVPMRAVRVLPVLALSGAALLTTGCANFTNVATPSATGSGAISGKAYGGRQPIAGALVQIYAAGETGYGSPASLLAATTTDANGAFNFPRGTYTCPTATQTNFSQTLYMTATGGQPTTGVTNTAVKLLLVLGDCNTVVTNQPNVVINEVTTIASMFALQQFFSPLTTASTTAGAESFGTSITNTQGLSNAAVTVTNLATLSSGFAVTTKNVTNAVAGYTTQPVVTITPETLKINTLADILASCVNTTGAASQQCGVLFSDVTPTGAQVTDTLQAAYYLATNPTSTNPQSGSNITALYQLVNAQAPYQSVLTTQPRDWTIGVTYGSVSAQTVGGSPVYFMNRPENIAIDQAGNIWMDNYFTTAAATVGNSVSEITNAGLPQNQVFTASGQLAGSFSIAIDTSNDVFVTNYGKSGALGTTVLEYTTNGATKSFTTAAGPTAVTIDGAGNAYVSTSSATGGGADLEAIPANSASGTAGTQLATGLIDSSFSELAVDGNGTLYLTTASTASPGTTQFLCQAGTATSAPSCAGTLTAVGNQGQAEPLALGLNNQVYIGSYSNATNNAGELSEINQNSTGAPFTSSLSVPASTVTGLNYIQKLAVDGANNSWIASTATTTGSITEISGSGLLLSPTPGNAGTAGFAHTYASVDKIAIDTSGNVWIGNVGTVSTSTAAPVAFLTEIVGQAAPTVTPIAYNLPGTPGNTPRFGTRP